MSGLAPAVPGLAEAQKGFYRGLPHYRPVAIARESFDDFLEKTISRVTRTDVTMLLAQEAMLTGRVGRSLQARAEQIFGRRRVYHLSAGGTEDSLEATFYGTLLRQLGEDDGEKSVDAVRRGLERRLEDDLPVCLMVSDLESGPESARRALGSMLRSLQTVQPEKAASSAHRRREACRSQIR